MPTGPCGLCACLPVLYVLFLICRPLCLSNSKASSENICLSFDSNETTEFVEKHFYFNNMRLVTIWTVMSHPVFCNQLLAWRQHLGSFPARARSVRTAPSRPLGPGPAIFLEDITFHYKLTKPTLYFKCHRLQFLSKYRFSTLFKRELVKRKVCFGAIVSFGSHLLWQASVGGTVSLPKAHLMWNVWKYQEGISFLLSFYCDAKNSWK